MVPRGLGLRTCISQAGHVSPSPVSTRILRRIKPPAPRSRGGHAKISELGGVCGLRAPTKTNYLPEVCMDPLRPVWRQMQTMESFPRNIAFSEFGRDVSKESETVLYVSGAITQINCPCDLQNSGSEMDPVIGPVSDLYLYSALTSAFQ